MKKLLVICLGVFAVFWNLENFFDWRMEDEGGKHWTYGRFHAKCHGIAKALLDLSAGAGEDFPDLIGFCEVGDAYVLRRLLSQTVLRKLDYAIIHFDSPDTRGIDCALLYRRGKLRPLSCEAVPLLSDNGDTIPTRSQLRCLFEDAGGDTLGVVVVHHPSKVGGAAAEGRRKAAIALTRELCLSTGPRCLCMGDFNEVADTENLSALAPLQDLSQPLRDEGRGSIKYDGAWELIDRALVYGAFSSARMGLFDDRSLSTRDNGFGGTKPLRTFTGPAYLGGISDHYPIWVALDY